MQATQLMKGRAHEDTELEELRLAVASFASLHLQLKEVQGQAQAMHRENQAALDGQKAHNRQLKEQLRDEMQSMEAARKTKLEELCAAVLPFASLDQELKEVRA